MGHGGVDVKREFIREETIKQCVCVMGKSTFA